MTYRNNKLRQSAQGQNCTMFGPTCTGGGEARNDVCWRHSNEQKHGKATGIKAHDIFGFYGCANCEDWYTGNTITKEQKKHYFRAANEQSLIVACELGVL